jgi:hypothetical protein
MAGNDRDMLTVLVRSAIGRRLRSPRSEYRAQARLTFEEALERHLAAKRPALRIVPSES